jgi:hypothetical protein
MKRRTPPFTVSNLEKFARKRLAAEDYPTDHHPFTLFRCSSCGVVPLALTIEHHTGSRKGDFKGLIFGRCSGCGAEQRIFGFTSARRKPVRQEKPVCRCGNASLWVAMMERIEGEHGLPGFFDEGVIVGQCSQCGRRVVLVCTD